MFARLSNAYRYVTGRETSAGLAANEDTVTLREHENYENVTHRAIKVDPSSDEFREIATYLTDRSSRKVSVVSIIKNTCRSHYDAMQRKHPTAEEKLLFHGTREAGNHKSIFSQGFLLSKALHGAFGKGVYFADDVDYSDGGGFCYATWVGGQRVKVILICRVLLVSGKYCKQRNIQAVYDDRLCFPEYLVTYM